MDPPNTSANALWARTGPAPKLIEGPRVGQRSLYSQQVLDEDTYTEALSHIITRDFFPNLPHVHATNAYLTALTNNDPELLSSSIRKLAQLAQEKEDGVAGSSKGKEAEKAKEARRRELENMGTPYISMPGMGSRRRTTRPGRTPIGAKGWDTPDIRGADTSRRHSDGEELDDVDEGIDETPGPSRRASQPRKKRKMTPEPPRVRDDLSLDAFQRNYTSEDNASFVQIVDKENQQRREDRWGWAWEVEKRSEARRIEGEERRKMILNAATSGEWRVGADGRRLIGGLAEGGRDRAEGEAWKGERRLLVEPAASQDAAAGDVVIENGDLADGTYGTALIPHASTSTSSALITSQDASGSQSRAVTERYNEEPIPADHPLGRALAAAGLPTTALVSKEDGALVPMREVTSGSGDGRGRGIGDKEERSLIERIVMGDQEREHLSLGGSGADGWGYKTRNNFYFPADANTAPYPKVQSLRTTDPTRQAPPAIAHANTRLPEDDDAVGPASRDRDRSSSRRGSSPARSWVAAAVKGTPYHPSGGSRSDIDEEDMPRINNYSLVASDPSPTPENLPSLLTWGTLLATPKALDGSDDPLDSASALSSGPSFRLPATQKRDELGRRLGNKASRDMNERAKGFTPRASGLSAPTSLSSKLRAAADRHAHVHAGRATPANSSATGAGQMLPPSSTPRRSDALTPAGKRLLERSIGRSPMLSSGRTSAGSASGRNRGAAMEIGNGWGATSGSKGKKPGEMSWTPSPAHRR